MNTMNDMSKWINSIADQVDQSRQDPPDEMIGKMEKLLFEIKARANLQAEINRQRDELIIRLAAILGISRDDYSDFFETVE
jgi:hypothetical protein